MKEQESSLFLKNQGLLNLKVDLMKQKIPSSVRIIKLTLFRDKFELYLFYGLFVVYYFQKQNIAKNGIFVY